MDLQIKQTTLQRSALLRKEFISQGYYLTNFGWLHKSWILKGIEWKAIKRTYKDQKKPPFDFTVVRTKQEGFLNFGAWLGYIDYERKNDDWYRSMKSRKTIARFREITGITAEIPTHWLDYIDAQEMKHFDK